MQNANVKDICCLVTNRMKTFTLVLRKRETTLFFLQCQKVNVFLIHPFTKVVAFQYGFAITLTCQCLIHFSLCPKCCLIFFFLAINLNTFGDPNISTLKSLHFHYVIILLSSSPTVVYPFFFMCSSYIFNHLFQRFI